MAYTVFRSDLMSGENVFADMVSIRVVDGNGDPVVVENGTIVELDKLEEGQREVWTATVATNSSDLVNCAVVATPEGWYDRKRNLDEFINPAGAIARGYRLRSNNMFSGTKEGFVSATAPTTAGAGVGIGTGGKINAAGTGLGTFEHTETQGRYTYYTVKIGVVDEA